VVAGGLDHLARLPVPAPDQWWDTESNDEHGTQQGERQPAIRAIGKRPRNTGENEHAKRQHGQHPVAADDRRNLFQGDRVACRFPVRTQPGITVGETFGAGSPDRIDRRLRADCPQLDAVDQYALG
jgi:hypothetical protein